MRGQLDQDWRAFLEEMVTEGRRERFRFVLANRTRFLTVALEDVYQLHNTSAVIRSCDAFGIQDVHLVQERFGERLDKKIAMGTQQWVTLHRYKNSLDCIHRLQSSGYRLVATSPDPTATPLSEFEPDRPVAVLFGTEKEGLSPELLSAADERICIPMKGFTESLNISVAAAIVLRELSQKIRSLRSEWRLSHAEQEELYWDWVRKSVRDVDQLEEWFRKRHNS